MESEGLATTDAITAEIKRLQADMLVVVAQVEGGLRHGSAAACLAKALQTHACL